MGRMFRILTNIALSIFMVICVIPMNCISQTSTNNKTASDNQYMQNVIDTSLREIYFEALIVEVDKGKDFKLGVKWKNVQTGFYDIDNENSPVIQMAVSVGVFGGDIVINGELFTDYGELIRYLKDETDIKVRRQPQASTINGLPISLFIIGKEPYEPSLSMDITPTIEGENIIWLNIAQRSTKRPKASKADITSSKIIKGFKTNISIKNGDTLVLSLLKNDNDRIETDSINEKKLYIFYTPHIKTMVDVEKSR
ncbi:MAG: hypothetical protein JXK07_16325 [Spirochaetes bacterium]|nr:hypothetical protein [Spirochaetota bacterium]